MPIRQVALSLENQRLKKSEVRSTSSEVSSFPIVDANKRIGYAKENLREGGRFSHKRTGYAKSDRLR